MAEVGFGIFLLQLNEAGVVDGIALGAEREAAGIVQPVAFREVAGDQQIDVQIDALFLEFGGEIVEAIQTLRMEEAARALFIVQQRSFLAARPVSDALADRRVGRVHADHVHAQAGETLGQALGVLVSRGIGAGGNVETQETGACAVFKDEMTVLDADEAVLACRRVQQVGEVQNALIGLGHGNTKVLFHVAPPAMLFLMLL